jgi:hypothetical protein
LIALLLLFAGRMFAQNSPEIRDVRPFIRADSLMCSFASPDLFSGSIRQTLLSGLPVLIELLPRLQGDNSVKGGLPNGKYQLSYDIWEDQFIIQSAGGKYTFSSLDALQKWWNPFAELALLPLNKLKKAAEFRLEINLRVILLTPSQSRKMKNWVLNAAETEENIPSMNRDTGFKLNLSFKLNLNQVVSLFLNKSDTGESFEVRGESAPFKIEELPHKEKVGSKQ